MKFNKVSIMYLFSIMNSLKTAEFGVSYGRVEWIVGVEGVWSWFGVYLELELEMRCAFETVAFYEMEIGLPSL